MPPETKKHNFDPASVACLKAAYGALVAIIDPSFGKEGQIIFPKVPQFSEEYQRIQDMLIEIESLLGVKTYKRKK